MIALDLFRCMRATENMCPFNVLLQDLNEVIYLCVCIYSSYVWACLHFWPRSSQRTTIPQRHDSQ